MECVELDIKREIFNGGYTKSVPGMLRLDVKRADYCKRYSSTTLRDDALVLFLVINRCVDYRRQAEENRFFDVLVLIRHLVSAGSENFACSFDNYIVTSVGKIVQIRDLILLLREKRKVVQNPNRFFPMSQRFSRDNGIPSLPRNTLIRSKT